MKIELSNKNENKNYVTIIYLFLGDPLVAMYCRTYLARQAHAVAPELKDHLIKNFKDFIFAHQLFTMDKFKVKVKASHVTFEEYLNLFSPALDWQLQCIGYKASEVKKKKKSVIKKNKK
jgi:hypothetical protein